ncbi:EAL domain-containing protein [Telmatospirillum siberiense]|uniref:bifunctional diguanylate cyclase/phosphodiesterase n=1 Tax=Telmatospirillum siberiense TaxID=382514 RepID=UPI0011AF4345|nr:EAL domain-containing protein [Telmatospirillum siberiense]
MPDRKVFIDKFSAPRSVVVTLTAGFLLLNLFVVALIGIDIHQSRKQHEELGRITTQNLAKAFQQDLANQVGKIDLALFILAQEYTRQHGRERLDGAALSEAIAAIKPTLPDIDGLSFFDAAGTLTVDSEGRTDVGIGDREYFVRLKNLREDRLLISKPVTGRLSGNRTLILARPLRKPDGSFAGAICGGLSIDRLQRQFATLDVGKKGLVSLRDSDMGLIARIPKVQSTATASGWNSTSRELQSSYAQNPREGTYVGISGTDQVERMVSYRQIDHYPLIVLVGLDKEDYLRGWRDDLLKGSGLAAIFLTMSALGAWLIRRGWKRQLVALHQLGRGEQQLRMLAENASDVISRLDPTGHYLYVSRSILPTTGYGETDLLGAAAADFAHPDDRSLLLLTDKVPLRHPEETRTIAYRFRHKDGHYVWLEANLRPVLDDTGRLLEFVVVSRDITQRKQADARIEFLAHHDPLTGLPNRLLGKDRMEVAMAGAGRTGSKATLLFLDLDHFKTVNDSLGHPLGDELLKLVAARLRECLEDTDTLSRQGGDEFLILPGELREVEPASLMAETILRRLGRPFRVDNQDLYMSASIGIAIYPDDGEDFDTLLRRAEIAMYHAKDVGRNTYRFFADQMNFDNSEYLRLRTGLQRALERDEFLLHYQPQIDLQSGEIVGLEALVRWQPPALEIVPPGRFIPMAEESGMIVSIGAWVLQEACRQAAVWHRAGQTKLVMAVNLSAVQFKRGDLLQTVTEALTASGLPPSCLELELTESILISDTAKVLSMVDQLKELGVKLSIDDFGTGYSCLAYLKRFRVDRLKIDQSFVRHITTDPNDEAIVRAIVQLANSLGLKTVAEGVESEAALQSLISLGCDDAQGYYFARPMTAADAAAFLSNDKASPVPRAM